MSVPSAVVQILQDHTAKQDSLAEDVERVVEVSANGAPKDSRVRAVLLTDDRGRLQVVLPEKAILDLDALNQKLGRKLRALEKAEVDAVKQQAHWQEIPALPELTGFPVVLDQRLKGLEEIFVPSTTSGRYLSMSRRLFEAVMGQTEVLEIGVSLPDLLVNHDNSHHDLDQIHAAIKSFTGLRICQRLEDTLELPPLPETAQRIIKLRVDPNAGISELADIVETDPSLAAQVVSWASSSFYAAPGKVRSVHDAIVRVLGFDLVMNLAMGLALGRTLDVPEESPDGFTPYWEQSVWTATLCGALATAIPKEKRPEFGLAYLTGLLHNFGYLVLAHVFPPHFSLICRYAEVNQHVDVENCEQHLLGVTREQIGSQLMYSWNMPDEVVTGIRFQKNPYYSGENSQYSALLYVTTQLLRSRGIGDGPAQPIPQSAWELLHLSPEGAEEVMQELLGLSEEMKILATSLSQPR
ncbi:signal transduction protein [Hahella sp. CCB-MM4]|uniref:HDOD domain-containing protein n=1 Tax=Hahella sp. (strain CCB-MM4) TaxID=1926491 RepID=UPI000B9A2409|nr:HDOD domain-containing protein [Hahella sp. CCB-MM4]OZG74239.1 signal transduction protein [Hahella sp. CCB-MM4]